MRALLLCLVLLTASCRTPFDYSDWLANPPRSILVLPPMDHTVETDACYGCLSTISLPLAEQGYYVFPVAVVDRMMRENGLPTPADMHAVSLEKLQEIFDPDAVLYLGVTDWGTSYQVLSSTSTVTVVGRLVDVDTGTEIWHGGRSLSQGSGGGGGVIGMLASALVTQVARSISDPSREISGAVHGQYIGDSVDGFLPGPYNQRHEEVMAAKRDEVAQSQ